MTLKSEIFILVFCLFVQLVISGKVQLSTTNSSLTDTDDFANSTSETSALLSTNESTLTTEENFINSTSKSTGKLTTNDSEISTRENVLNSTTKDQLSTNDSIFTTEENLKTSTLELIAQSSTIVSTPKAESSSNSTSYSTDELSTKGFTENVTDFSWNYTVSCNESKKIEEFVTNVAVNITEEAGETCSFQLDLHEGNALKDSFSEIVISPDSLKVSKNVNVSYKSLVTKKEESCMLLPYNPDERRIFKPRFPLDGNVIKFQFAVSSNDAMGFQLIKHPKRVLPHNVTEDEGEFQLADVENYTGYTKNTEILIFFLSEHNGTKGYVELKIEELILDKTGADFVIIGAGNKMDALQSTFAYMVTDSLKKSDDVTFKVEDKDAYVFFAQMLSEKTDASLKISFKRTSSTVITENPYTIKPPITDAQLEELPLCFRNIKNGSLTCAQFLNNGLDRFKTVIADIAQLYAYQKNIDLPLSGGIRPNHVEVKCFWQGEGKDTRIYITVVIINQLDKEKAVLRKRELQYMILKRKDEITRLLDYQYEVDICSSYPNYWIWYWGALASFVICTLVIAFAWFVIKQDSRRKNYGRTNSPDKTDSSNEKGKINFGFTNDGNQHCSHEPTNNDGTDVALYNNRHPDYEMPDNQGSVPENNQNADPYDMKLQLPVSVDPIPSTSNAAYEVPQEFPEMAGPKDEAHSSADQELNTLNDKRNEMNDDDDDTETKM